MFSGSAGQRAIGLGGEPWLFLTTLGPGSSEGAVCAPTEAVSGCGIFFL